MDISKEEVFMVEFQPSGLRLIIAEPITLLDAARHAGISLRADCGGKGICGKCKVQLLSSKKEYPVSKIEASKLESHEISVGIRLACETIAKSNLKVFIPPDSVIEGQILQVEGRQGEIPSEPSITQQFIKVNSAKLDDLHSDFSRIKNCIGDEDLSAEMDVFRRIPGLLRENKWQVNLIQRKNKVIHATDQPLEKLAGLAVDVGSTKLACYLVDLENGKTLAAGGVPNPQIAFGEDIMARLAYALESSENAGHLQHILFESINQTASMLAKQAGIYQDQIVDACLVGNTAMHHLLLKLPVGSLAVSPFVPVINHAINPLASELHMAVMPGCAVYVPPLIAGFVGSDHLAFLLAEGFGNDKRIRLGIDIGTNTEIALQKGSRIVSVSTASGPAFEGAHIRCGMRAAPGAIEHVTLDNEGKAEIQVIGDKPATGICGSGILDAVAEMRRSGLLNFRGRMDKQHPGVSKDENGKPFVILAEGEKLISLSQGDVDQILLAKGAIRAGIDVLMDHLEVKASEIDEVVIAGAFGTFMLPEQAMRIGMLPEIHLERVQAVGNAAGAGARMMLASMSARKKAEALAGKIEYLELTVYPEFPMFYALGIQS